ncbi:MAG: hypothetical protein ACOYY2_03025 [Actinomycetota bacterium]
MSPFVTVETHDGEVYVGTLERCGKGGSICLVYSGRGRPKVLARDEIAEIRPADKHNPLLEVVKS